MYSKYVEQRGPKNMKEQEWVDKYKPQTLEELIIDEENYNIFKAKLDEETFLNCTLYGRQGIGKTSIAKIVINTIPNCTHLFINASAENGVDVIRSKITSFTQFVGYSKTKIVVLDEVNRMSKAAQDTLRTLIEDCIDDTRFILTTNYINDLSDPLKSRCIPINITPPAKKIIARLVEILKAEDIEISKDEVKVIHENIIKPNYPDIRAMVKHLELCCMTGTFELVKYKNNDTLVALAETIKENMKNMKKCRTIWLEREAEFDKDYQFLAGVLYNTYFETPEKMHIIAQYLRDMPHVLDQEIQFNDLIHTIGELE